MLMYHTKGMKIKICFRIVAEWKSTDQLCRSGEIAAKDEGGEERGVKFAEGVKERGASGQELRRNVQRMNPTEKTCRECEMPANRWSSTAQHSEIELRGRCAPTERRWLSVSDRRIPVVKER
ncbi:hypothetical protein SAY87_012290 [Trapa incisa]|uniref:Uncharacterized protein n=1 Tax=Trapa incisa TaxID=236973 RepID=A0AAN7GJT3_9MYRT|nr:hypothetical protein SAY87_012290 [Trapa incisa]